MMNIKVTQNEEITTIALSGRLDTTASPTLQDALIPKLGYKKHVVLDLAKLDYISSAGLRVLLLGEKTAKAQSGKQTLTNVSPEVMGVFEMTGFSNILHFD